MRKLFKLSICILAIVAGLAACTKDGKKGVAITGVTIYCQGEPVVENHVTRVDSISYFKVEVEPKNATENLIWEVEGEEIMTKYKVEDESGRNVALIGLGEGETNVKLSTESGFSASFRALVFRNPIKVEDFKLSETTLTVKVGESATLKAILTPEDAEDEIYWEISDPSVLEYDWEENMEYYFSAIKVGSAKVIASCGDLKRECKVTVVTNYTPLTGVSLPNNTYQVAEGDMFDISPIFTPSNASNKAMTWEIGDSKIVSYEGSVGGVANFIARKTGATTLKGTSVDGGKVVYAAIKVTPPPVPEGAVDLGYRYGERPVFFAKSNLGSNDPYSIGELYAWGDKEVYYTREGPYVVKWHEGKSKGYAKESYKWYDSATKTFTKYTDSSRKVSLELADDPAQQILGDNWRMPNSADLFWLTQHCAWIVDYDHLCYMVVSTEPGFEGNQIIVPMTGYYIGTKYSGYGQVHGMSIEAFSTNLASSMMYYNGDGTYSDDAIDVINAHMIMIESHLFKDVVMCKGLRYEGYTIRPVWETRMKK